MSELRLNQPRPPKCSECGSHANVHAISRPGMIPGAALSYMWLCGDCEYIMERADAALIQPPMRKPKIPQLETLF